MANFFTTASSASAGVREARESELHGLAFEEQRDAIYRARDTRELMKGVPDGGALGIPGLPDINPPTEDLFGNFEAPEMYNASSDIGDEDAFVANMRTSLAGTESSIDGYGAQNSEGYTGRLQYGDARLMDAKRAGIIPMSMTKEQFRNDRAAQERVEDWSIRDSLRYIRQNNLDRFIGQNINGTPVTMSGLVAAAHLGGKEGMRKFVESAGRYNPADSNQTTLLSYLKKHGGISGAPGQYEVAISTSDADFSPSAGVKTSGQFVDPKQALTAGLNQQTAELAGTGWQDAKAGIIASVSELTATRDPFGSALSTGLPMNEGMTSTHPASRWYASKEAEQYFSFNPDKIEEAKADPLGFYEKHKDAALVQDRFAGEPMDPAKVEANERAQVGLRQDIDTQSASSTSEATPAPLKPRVSKAVEAALGKSEGLMNMELQRARQKQQIIQQQVRQRHAALQQEFNRQRQIADIARRTGSTELRAQAMTRMDEIRQEALGLGTEYASAQMAAEKETHSLAADMAIRDLERNGNPARLAALWRKLGGLNVQVQPRTDGKFNVVTLGPDGQPKAVVVEKNVLVNYFFNDLFDSVRTTGSQADAAKASAYLEAQVDVWKKNMEQMGEAKIAHMKAVLDGRKSLAGYHPFVKDETGNGRMVALSKDGTHSIVVDPTTIDPDTGFTRENMRILYNSDSVGLRQ